jgi:G3E family GTPase
MAKATRIVLVGGFLGAGKTTLLWQAARRLSARGKRVGCITNDQAPDLVDTHLLAAEGTDVDEVCGSCFCCNFPGLLRAAHRLGHRINADVLIAEPVGSCTDLSATILQPLKDQFRRDFVVAPLTVLLDPARLGELGAAGEAGALHESAAYIVRKQLEEADVVALSKSDLWDTGDRRTHAAIASRLVTGAQPLWLSAVSGEGIEAWLDMVMSDESPARAGARIAEVDYDTYAQGEAVLGWLNASILLEQSAASVDWQAMLMALVESLRQHVAARGLAVGHVKMLMSAGDSRCVVNLTSASSPAQPHGAAKAGERHAGLIVNARVQMPPAELEQLVRALLSEAAARAGATVTVRNLQCFSPGRPNPTHRYSSVVQGRASE